jgi:hypothetical protein
MEEKFNYVSHSVYHVSNSRVKATELIIREWKRHLETSCLQPHCHHGRFEKKRELIKKKDLVGLNVMSWE